MLKTGRIIMFSIFSVNTFAALGDRAEFYQVQKNLVITADYAVHETEKNQVLIREYVANGVVFAVAWEGMTQPNLTELLGKYFGDYQESAVQTPKVRGMRFQRRVQGEGVVVETYGHMRSMQGRAYAPALMPKGVSADEIK